MALSCNLNYRTAEDVFVTFAFCVSSCSQIENIMNQTNMSQVKVLTATDEPSYRNTSYELSLNQVGQSNGRHNNPESFPYVESETELLRQRPTTVVIMTLTGVNFQAVQAV